MIFGYARVSARDQNLDTQAEQLEKAGADLIHLEKVSGAARQRPELDMMMGGLRAGDTVMVTRLNRLGRNSQHLLELVATIAAKGARFVSLDLGIDTSTITGSLVLKIFAALAEYDRESIKERTRAGIELAQAKGTPMGRRPGRDVANLAKVRTALAEGLSVSKIANLTGISLSSVKRYKREIEAAAEAQQKSPS